MDMNHNLEKQIKNYRYNFQDYLGQGSYSKVFLGKDLVTGSQVAIKIMDQQRLKDQYNQQLFKNEINVMKKLDNNHLVKLFDVLFTYNNVYIIQEFCNQGDLEKLLATHKKFPEPQALRIIYDIILGYREMLTHNVIHRDLKLANVFISDGQYKIGDFGFAIKLNNKDEIIQTELVGTPIYMSPQCMQKIQYSSKSDIWSLGVMYYELLFGETPWKAQTQQELLINIYRYKVQFPRHIQISNDSKDFIIRCLQLEEKDRISWDDTLNHPLFKNLSLSGIKIDQRHRSLKKIKDDLMNLEKVSRKTNPIVERIWSPKKRVKGESPKASLNKDFIINDQRIKFTLNFVKMMQLILNKIENCEKNSEGVDIAFYQKLQFLLVKNMMIESQPLHQAQLNPKNAHSGLLKLQNYLDSPNFLYHKPEIEKTYQLSSENYKFIQQSLKNSQEFQQELSLHENLKLIWQCDLQDSLGFYQQSQFFLIQAVRKLNHLIKVKMQNFKINKYDEYYIQLMQKLVHYISIIQQKIKIMSYLDDYDALLQTFDFEQINQNKNMVYKDYKVIKHEINQIQVI